MAGKSSFNVASLLQVTPRSLKRRRLLSRCSTPVTPRSKRITPRRRKKRTPKCSHRPTEVPAADSHISGVDLFGEPRRTLDLSSPELLVLPATTESHFLPQPTSHYLRDVSKKVGESYPSLRQRAVTDSSGAMEWLELIPPGVLIDAVLGPADLVRLLISDSQYYRLQVLFPFTRNAVTGVFKTYDELEDVVRKLVPGSGFVFCPGLPTEAYKDCYMVIRYHSNVLNVITQPVECYESKNCCLWHKTPRWSGLKDRVDLKDTCTNCKKAYNHVKTLAENAVQLDEEARKARLATSSNYSISKLSPASQTKRHSQLKKEKAHYLKLAHEISKSTGVTLDDDQTNELSSFITTIDSSDTGSAILQDIYKEAEESGEGRGEVLKEVWRECQDKAMFFRDQKRNKTGSKGNRWSLISYRIALAVYSRSPAAFDAIRNLKILQLPSKTSLQAYIGHHLRDPGANDECLALQFKLYKQHQKKRVEKGFPTPTGDGILIFDEVRVQGKVVWNSKNNQLIGLAMSHKDLPSLQDVYAQLDSEDGCRETRYILQFVWRDLTSKFDIVGPYYTSNVGFDMKFTMSCFYDALLLFETYQFRTLAIIGDGASWNHALFKKLCGHSGKFGVDAVPDRDLFDVPTSFTNPFSGVRVWCIVCPSHELKSLVSALYNSGMNRTKHFCKAGSYFGWDTIERMWTREVGRSERGEMAVIPRMKASYVYRDSWTRLNVTPAKIMQQQAVIAEIRTHQDSDIDVDVQGRDSATLEYLQALNKIFETGLLSKDRIKETDSVPLTNIQVGIDFFNTWCDEVIAHGGDILDDRQTTFLAWQTWDLLRLTVQGFQGLCTDFLVRNPGYFIKPVRVNGSVVESLFGRFKYNADGNLSGVNYRGCVASLIISDAVKGREDYRTSIDLKDVLNKKKRKRGEE